MKHLRPLVLVITFLISQNVFAHAANPVPFVAQPLVPTSVAPGGPSFTLTVNGTGFVSSSVVNWNGSPRSTTFVSTSQLKASIPSTDIANPGTAIVIVISPNAAQSNISWLPIRTATKALVFSGTQVAMGGMPFALVSADFNHDGKADVAAVGGFSSLAKLAHHVGVLLGNGNGTFQKPVDYKTTPNPTSVIAADFNGDGNLDLAVATGFGGRVGLSIFLSNGDGTFQAERKYITGLVFASFPSVSTADFNGDGKLDLVIAGSDTDQISIMLGNGDGTFQPPMLPNLTNGEIADGVIVGDFNGDGKLDLLIAVPTASLYVALGNGDGTFRQLTSFSVTPSAGGFALADLNGDGILDLVISSTNVTWVLLGNGDGTFQTPVGYPNVSGLGGGAVIADLNGDGKLDVIINYQTQISYLLGNGDGTFQNFVAFDATSTGTVSVADFNGDGKLDFIAPFVQTTGFSGVFLYQQQ